MKDSLWKQLKQDAEKAVLTGVMIVQSLAGIGKSSAGNIVSNAENYPKEEILAGVVIENNDTSEVEQFSSPEKTQMTAEEIAQNNNLAKLYLEQLKNSVNINKENKIAYSDCGVGHFSCIDIGTSAFISTLNNSSVNLYKSDKIVNRNNIKFVTRGDEKFKEGSRAYQNQRTGMIYMMNFEGKIESEDLRDIEYAKKNPVIVASTLYHEINHAVDYEEMNKQNTFIDRYKADRLTEKVSCAIQYNNAAYLYTILRDQGMATIEINGEVKPIESILESFEGLKEYFHHNDYSPLSKKDVRSVTEISSKYWNEKRYKGYIGQHVANAVRQKSNFLDIFDTNEESYNSAAKNMVKNRYIGFNTYIDLTHCLDLLDDISKEKILTDVAEYPVQGFIKFKEVVKISEYLETKGLHTNKEKRYYVIDNYNKILYRGKYDEELKNLMVQEYGKIIYADGLVEKFDSSGRHTITGDLGTADISLYEKSFSANIDVKDHINALRTSSSRESNTVKYNQSSSNLSNNIVMMKLRGENSK